MFNKPIDGQDLKSVTTVEDTIIRGQQVPVYFITKDLKNKFVYYVDTFDFATFTPFGIYSSNLWSVFYLRSF